MDVTLVLKLFAVVLSVTICRGQSSWYSFLSCKYIESRDCYGYGYYPECGTDGVTYRNRCDFSKAHCSIKELNVLHYGTCQPGDFTTMPTTVKNTPNAITTTGTTSGITVRPTPVVTSKSTVNPLLSGSEAVLDFFCLQLSHIGCSKELDPICGTDNKTYENACEFEKSKCTHRDLHIQAFEACTT